MFDIGFLEIIVIMVIALIVIGPERMPEVARKLGRMMGKAKNFMNSVKDNSEISDAMKEIKQSINLEEEKKHLEEVSGSLKNDLSTLQEQYGIEGEIARPFGKKADDEELASEATQFNKAPAQPTLPETEQSADSDTTAPKEPLDYPVAASSSASKPDDAPANNDQTAPKA